MTRFFVMSLLALLLMSPLVVMAQDEGETGQGIARVCMVLNGEVLEDGTFNEVAYQGMLDIRSDYDLAEEDTVYKTTQGPEDWPEQIQACVDEGMDVVITVGFPQADATMAAARENPDVYFIGVDQFVNDGPENYVGIQFREDEGGFLMGYLAGLVTESNIVAGVYGPDIPVIRRFRNGFENGVKLAEAELDQDIIILGGYLGGFSDPDAGETAAAAFIAEGADVIFGAAGFTGTGAIRHAAQQGVYVIGVDQDEYYTTFDAGEVDGAEYVISSALKRVDVGVYDMLSVLLDGDMEAWPGGSNYVLSLENGGISLAQAHEADVPDAVYDRVVNLAGRMVSGEVSTGVDPVTGELLPDEAAPVEATPETTPEQGS